MANLQPLNTRQYFTDIEKKILTDLVDKYKDVIESKRNDFYTITKKIEGWDQIALEFNAHENVLKREVKQLKKCWENLKARAKRATVRLQQQALMDNEQPPLTESEMQTGLVGMYSQASKSENDRPLDTLRKPQDKYHRVVLQLSSDTPNSLTVPSNVSQDPLSNQLTLNEAHLILTKAATALKRKRGHDTADSYYSQPAEMQDETRAQQGRGETQEAHAQFLALHHEQHKMEMTILAKKAKFMEEEHKRKMDVLDMKYRYWSKLCSDGYASPDPNT